VFAVATTPVCAVDKTFATENENVWFRCSTRRVCGYLDVPMQILMDGVAVTLEGYNYLDWVIGARYVANASVTCIVTINTIVTTIRCQNVTIIGGIYHHLYLNSLSLCLSE